MKNRPWVRPAFMRPVLCRLCRCPVTDSKDELLVHKLDFGKFSRWCLKTPGIQIEKKRGRNCKSICQFCLWDAKFLGRHQNSKGCDWWTGHDKNSFFKKYYFTEKVIRPCAVTILPLHREEAKKETFECPHCDRSLASANILHRHLQSVHQVQAPILPTFRNLVRVICVYCGRTLVDRVNLRLHMHQVHFAEHKKCPVYRCPEYFFTDAGVKRHLEERHPDEERLRKFKCQWCGFGAKTLVVLKRHVLHKHGTGAKVECTECRMVFNSSYAMSKHKKHVHCEKQTCRFCQGQVKDLQYHLRCGPCLRCAQVIPCRGSTMSHYRVCTAPKRTICSEITESLQK